MMGLIVNETKMKKILVLLLVAVICLSFAACGGSKENKIVGKWKIDDGPWTIKFNKDGTGEDPDGESLTWEYNSKTEKYDVEFLYYTVIADQIVLDNSDHCPVYVDFNL